MSFPIPQTKPAWKELRDTLKNRNYQKLKNVSREDIETFRTLLLYVTDLKRVLLHQFLFLTPSFLIFVLEPYINLSQTLYIALLFSTFLIGGILSGFLLRMKSLKLYRFGIDKKIFQS